MTEQGNGARFGAVPLSCGGTPSSVWLGVAPHPRLDLSRCRGLIVLSAHPDDETLGLGATIAALAAGGVDVLVVSVSDGGAEYGASSGAEQARLESTRRLELRRATDVLGVRAPMSLGLPDGRLGAHEPQLVDMLTQILSNASEGTWCAATWRGDGHPDHEAVGRAAAAACAIAEMPLLEYPIWMWHWARPGDPDVPWGRAYAAAAPRWARLCKSYAAQCFHSQIEQRDTHTPPVVPEFALRRLLAVDELVFR